MTLTLDAAQRVIGGALAAASDCKAKPLAVVVLDRGGHPVAMARQDGASLFRHNIARAKAYGALGMGADSGELANRAKGNPIFYASVCAAVDGEIAFSPGGVLVKSQSGEIIGAVGISGDTGDCDEACAIAGLRVAGLYRETAA